MEDLRSLYTQHIARLQQRYETVLANRQLDAIVIGSGVANAKSRFDDQFWPFLPTPAFSHWLPLMEPDCYVIIRPNKRPTLIQTVVDDYWHSPIEPENDFFWNEFEVISVKPGAAKQHFPVLRTEHVTRDPLSVTGATVNSPDTLAAIDACRVSKSEYEIQCLIEATKRAVKGHHAIERAFLEGEKSELTLHHTYLAASNQDALDTPYQNIIALGAHAAILHHVVYDRRLMGKNDMSLLVDAGAKYLGYGSDITRTYARGAGAGARQFASLIAAVDGVQRELCEMLEVGMEYEELHDKSHFMLAAALEEIGLLRGPADECVASGVTRALFPHGLGHSIGIVTHDVGCKPRPPKPENKYLRTTSVIGADNVFTIEPGVYFIESLLSPLRSDDRKNLVNWPLVDVLKPFGGVRIEDNVQVQLDGVRNLTREALTPGYVPPPRREAKPSDQRGRSGTATMDPFAQNGNESDDFI